MNLSFRGATPDILPFMRCSAWTTQSWCFQSVISAKQAIYQGKGRSPINLYAASRRACSKASTVISSTFSACGSFPALMDFINVSQVSCIVPFR